LRGLRDLAGHTYITAQSLVAARATQRKLPQNLRPIFMAYKRAMFSLVAVPLLLMAALQ
jgi:hypothetical protein